MLSKHASVIQTSIAVLFGAGLISCMTSPHNGTEVEDRNGMIELSGYIHVANQPVEVQALDKDDGNWYPIETAASGYNSALRLFSTDLYLWEADSTPIPIWAWQPGSVGYEAKVRAIWGYSGAVADTFDMPILELYDCIRESSGWAEVRENCSSEENGVVTIRTEDFEE